MSFDLILFGGTGDLVWRKLLPALFQAFRHGSLPAGGRIVGVARDDLSDAHYRALIKARFEGVELAKQPTEEEFSRFADLLFYLRMDLSSPADTPDWGHCFQPTQQIRWSCTWPLRLVCSPRFASRLPSLA